MACRRYHLSQILCEQAHEQVKKRSGLGHMEANVSTGFTSDISY
jgi:hypothetical protein